MTTILSGDNSLEVVQTFSGMPYVTADYADARAVEGDVRCNNGNLEVYTNTCWTIIAESYTDVQLSYRWKSVLEWAEQAMEADMKEKELLEKSSALRKAKENYDIIKALIEND